MAYCIKCGQEINDSAVFCTYCGAEQKKVVTVEPVVEPVVEPAVEPVVESVVVEEKKGSALGLISMILGILSVLCCAGGCLGTFFAIAAIILAIVEKSKTGKMSGMALAGLITGIAGIVVTIISTIVFLPILPDLIDEMMYY